MTPRWQTPDAAIRAAFAGPSIGIDYARVSGDRHQAELFEEDKARVIAAVGKLPKREQQILKAYASTNLGYRKIAEAAGMSPTHARRLHLAARDRVAKRLRELNLIEA